jgi:hypothetical protein
VGVAPAIHGPHKGVNRLIVVVGSVQDEHWSGYMDASARSGTPARAHAAEMNGVDITRETNKYVTQQPLLERRPIPLHRCKTDWRYEVLVSCI